MLNFILHNYNRNAMSFRVILSFIIVTGTLLRTLEIIMYIIIEHFSIAILILYPLIMFVLR